MVKKGLSLALILIFVGFFYVNDVFYMIDNNLTDRITSESRNGDANIKILAVDDGSLAAIGQWPWPRDIIANTIEMLVSHGAKAVWPDIIYSEKAQNPQEDQVWETLLKQYKNVYLPIYFEFNAVQKSEQDLAFDHISWPIFQVDENQVGHINVMEDQDGKNRKVMLGIPDENNQMIPAISVRLANLLLPRDRQITYSNNEWKSGSELIRTNLHNEVYFSYASSPENPRFETIPIYKVIDGEIDPSYFENSIVLIGPYAVGLQDMYYTPVSNTKMYGVEIHANIIQSLLDGLTYTKLSKTLGSIILILLTVLAFFLMERVRARRAILVFLGFVIVYSLVVFTVLTLNRVLLPYFYPILALIIAYITSVVSQYLKERRERSRVTGIFGRYVSKSVVNEILANKEEIKVGGVRKDVTLMFVDIRGFTPLSEKMEPEDVINILNEYLDLCTRAVFAYEGTLDKFIGDGVMSIFGAPIEQADHTERAIKAALHMKKEADKLADRLQEKYGRTVRFGIGINSGPAVVGNIGSQDRLDYTAIGDTVNLAARLESNAKPGQILISKPTYERVMDKFRVSPLDAIKVKGREQLVEIYQVEGERSGSDDDEQGNAARSLQVKLDSGEVGLHLNLS